MTDTEWAEWLDLLGRYKEYTLRELVVSLDAYRQDAQALYDDNILLRELAWDTLCAEPMPKLNHTYAETESVDTP